MKKYRTLDRYVHCYKNNFSLRKISGNLKVPFIWSNVVHGRRIIRLATRATLGEPTFPSFPHKTWRKFDPPSQFTLFIMVGSPSKSVQPFSILTILFAQPGQLVEGETIRECATAVLDNQITYRACTNAVGSDNFFLI